ncbi:MAG: hypothetical protein VB108_05675 [Anaerolineaceae bacterium]|nr:hypothetical protein [Anaerolineaceae bacterium]
MHSAPSYTEWQLEDLNREIAKRRLESEKSWSSDLNLAMELVAEACMPVKGSSYTRSLSIGVETREGRPWFEVSNIFVQEDNGDYTLLQGWNDTNGPVIWFEGPDLAPLCCLAWLTVSDSSKRAKKTQKSMGVAIYDKLTLIANQKRIEAVSDSLEESLKAHNLILSREEIESAVAKAFRD